MALPLAASLSFLLSRHVLVSFLDLSQNLALYHASLWRMPLRRLLPGVISSVMLPLVACWLPIFVAQRRWRRPLDQALLLGFLFGAVSFWVQGRGYPYHRYPSEVFLLLLVSLAFTDAWKLERGKADWALMALAGVGLVFGAAVIVPRSVVQVLRFDAGHGPLGQSLESDLNALGGGNLSGQVQCFDMAGGCIATLYRMRLVQSTGFLYDCYLYPAPDGSARDLAERDRYREAFKRAFLLRRPRFLVVTSDECGPADYQYRKLDRWAWLGETLANDYELSYERRPGGLLRWGGKPISAYGYRIYVESASTRGLRP